MIIRGRDYEHTLAMLAGTAADIAYRPVELGPLIQDILNGKPFDAGEFTLAGHMMMKDRGAADLIGIPVFPARAFFHSCLWVRRDSPLRSLRDLAGRRVGLRDYSSTTSVWFRGHLKETHGVDWADIAWAVGPNRRFPPPPAADIRAAAGDLEDMLLAGEIDMFFSIRVRDGRKPPEARELRPLLDDPQGAEAAYMAATGLYPLLHMVVVSKALADADPGGPRRIYDAYAAAKQAALTRRLGGTFLPWGERNWDATLDRFGGDPLPYGLNEANRRNVRMLAGYLHDQHLIERLPDLDALFWPGSADWPAA